MTALDGLDQGPLALRARQLLTMVPGEGDAIRQPPDPSDLASLKARDADIVGLIEDGGVLIDQGALVYVGPWSGMPKHKGAPTVEVGCVTPGWIDCHTHSVFAGSRHDEFTLRNLGARYLDILEAGGGIHASVQSLRRSGRRALTDQLIARCFEFTRQGVTTLEVKSGYGLATDEEIKQLRAIDDARGEVLVDLEATFLGAHVVPRKFTDTRSDYVDMVCAEMIPLVAERGLARFCDVFCDRGAFDAAEAERILRAGLDHGLIPRIHADELSCAGAAEVAAAVGAASADHLEFVSEAAIAAMATAGVVAVLLPAVNLFLQVERHAPARKLLEAGVDVALSTDFNPGTAMTQDLGLILTLACTGYAMTPGEALVGVTRSAARALRRPDRGVLQVGKKADLTIFGVEDFWELPYVPGRRPVEGVIKDGTLVYWQSAREIE